MSWHKERERHTLSRYGIKTARGRRRKRDDISPDMKNLKMNDEVYKLRRKVIDIIYDAKKLADLPYITVRVTEPGTKIIDGDKYWILGQALIDGNTIWISNSAISMSKDELRMTVYHEILHSVFGIRHRKNCPLMNPEHGNVLSKEEADRIFRKYTKEVIK